jgi:hypothetical protein
MTPESISNVLESMHTSMHIAEKIIVTYARVFSCTVPFSLWPVEQVLREVNYWLALTFGIFLYVPFKNSLFANWEMWGQGQVKLLFCIKILHRHIFSLLNLNIVQPVTLIAAPYTGTMWGPLKVSVQLSQCLPIISLLLTKYKVC